MSTSWLWSFMTIQKRFVFVRGSTGRRSSYSASVADVLQFRKKYSWDESAFASGRDGTAPADGASCTWTK